MTNKVKVEIKNRWTGSILFTWESSKDNYRDQLGEAVKEGIKSKANLSEANLSWANLSKADLSKADLSEANLSWADLSEANLSKANLSWANLSKANLSKANLSWANLSWANLSWANLSKADLSKADLSKADLSKADLSEANLSWADLGHIKTDLIYEILKLPNEIPALRQALIDGKVDGSTYSGECSCLAGTIAKAKGIKRYDGQDINLGKLTFHASASSPRERWFMGIKKGDTPETNQVSKIALEWVDEALAIVENIKEMHNAKDDL